MSPRPIRDPNRRPLVLPERVRTSGARVPEPAETPGEGTEAAHMTGETEVGPTPGDATATRAADWAGHTVLIPRSPGRATDLVDRLTACGARVLVCPVTTQVPVEDLEPVDTALRAIADGHFGWVAVTSVNAVDALSAAAARAGISSLGQLPTRWAAVGPATGAAIEAQGASVDLMPTEHSAAGMVGAFAAATLPPARILLPLGDLATTTLADGLRTHGHAPQVVTVYRTVPREVTPQVHADWTAGAVDAVVLTSPSIARQVAAQLGPRHRVSGVAIGRPTADAARDVGLRVDAVSTEATTDALLRALASALGIIPDPSPQEAS